MEIDIGIYIKLPKYIFDESARLNTELSIINPKTSDIKSIYHITLWQGRVCNESLEKIKADILSALALQKFTVVMHPEIKVVGNNIFWECLPSKQLQDLHEQMIQIGARYMSDILPQFKHFDYSKVKLHEESTLGDIKTFGMANVKSRYNPHITVAYQVGEAMKYSALPSASSPVFNFKLEEIAIGEIGHWGHMLKELHAFDITA